MILTKMNHPNVISLYEYFESEKFISIIMNNVPGTSLLQELESHKEDYTTKRIANILWQIAKAVRHLKAKDIIWCNFSHHNIIYDGQDLRICGFSRSRVKVKRDLRQAQSILGLRGEIHKGTLAMLLRKCWRKSTMDCVMMSGGWEFWPFSYFQGSFPLMERLNRKSAKKWWIRLQTGKWWETDALIPKSFYWSGECWKRIKPSDWPSNKSWLMDSSAFWDNLTPRWNSLEIGISFHQRNILSQSEVY